MWSDAGILVRVEIDGDKNINGLLVVANHDDEAGDLLGLSTEETVGLDGAVVIPVNVAGDGLAGDGSLALDGGGLRGWIRGRWRAGAVVCFCFVVACAVIITRVGESCEGDIVHVFGH